jgi:hypothetical protein
MPVAIPVLKILIIVGTTSFLGGATGGWYATSQYKDAKFSAYKAQADLLFNQAKTQAEATDKRNQEIAKELDNAHQQNKTRVDALTRQLASVRMRDPNARSCPVPSTSTATPDTEDAATGADISAQLAELLRAESQRADEAALYAQTCYQWIKDVYSEQTKPR